MFRCSSPIDQVTNMSGQHLLMQTMIAYHSEIFDVVDDDDEGESGDGRWRARFAINLKSCDVIFSRCH